MEAPSDDAINRAEAAWSLDLDDERRAILKNTDTIDIRACPGSGKTTLLVVKLALLASQWTSKHTGICVLSHTNAARREIERHLSKHPSLSPLLTYPHLVGTIQKFLHEFLGTPAAIEAFGTRPHIVDNDHYTKEATTAFYQGMRTDRRFRGAKIFIEKQLTNNRQVTFDDYIGSFEYLNANLDLKPLGTKKRQVDWDTATGQAIIKHKEDLSRQGIFRYQDMAALAARYATQHPSIAAIISQRFPIVLIDETQDTIEEQATLIKQLFAERSIVQRFGDDRQAIYHSNNTRKSGAKFPVGTTLSMQRSFRLSPSIARLAQHTCNDQDPEDLEGNPSRKDRQHTIFVFNRDTIGNVLPAFADLVAKELGPTTKDEVKAVGANTKPKPEENKFPSAVTDYWCQYEAPHHQKKKRITCLPGAIAQAQTELETTGATGDARNTLLRACAQLLQSQSLTNNDKPYSPSSLVRYLRDEHPIIHQELLGFLADTIRTTNPDPGATGDALRAILDPLVEQWDGNALTFCNEQTNAEQTGASEPTYAPNVYRHEIPDGPVDVTVGTIHSVKGQTLKATLVLETCNYGNDLRQLVERGPLLGKPPRKHGTRFEEHLRRVFVALTRPTDLLCLAIFDEHLTDDQRTALESCGWAITDI